MFDWVIVDGNRESDPWIVIKDYLDTGEFGYFGCTVMPGPQLRQAIPYTKEIKINYPEISVIWGGYFASNQYKVALNSGYVDFIINGPGDIAFPLLLQSLDENEPFEFIQNLIFKTEDGEFIKTSKQSMVDQDSLPALPYEKLNGFYPINKYLRKTEKRTVEFSKLIAPHNMTWWGEGRIDTIDKYSDESLKIMADSGCKMIFLGAESGSDDILESIDKGGKQTGEQIKAFAKRMKDHGMVPEYSFVLGFPGKDDETVMRQ